MIENVKDFNKERLNFLHFAIAYLLFQVLKKGPLRSF